MIRPKTAPIVNTPSPFSNQDLFGFLLKTIPDQVYFKDREGRFLCVSDAVAKRFGFSDVQEVIGKTDYDFHAAAFAKEAALDEQKIIQSGQPLIGKVERAIRANGGVVWTYTTKVPLKNDAGEIIGICGINKDFTAVHEMEEALRAERNRLLQITEELQAKNAQLAADMEMAREVQQALLPRDYPSFAGSHGGLAFTHDYRPAAAVGGDFFVLIPLSQTRAGVLICDVMGHGLRAALITAMIRGLLEELRPAMEDPGHLMSLLNFHLRSILKNVDEPLIATAFYMVVDTESREVLFANAAHPEPIYLGRDRGVFETLHLETPPATAALGLFDDFAYSTGVHPFAENDRIILFTDGLYEIESPKGEEFGRKAVMASFCRHAALPAAEQFAAVMADVSRFSARTDFDDDVCLVAIDRTPGCPA
jgi:sigma-B regulation protein RsbU (phosphoserine phosphatase)